MDEKSNDSISRDIGIDIATSSSDYYSSVFGKIF